ncbi:hypothetical protein F4776DRAFT_436784 [Hypoxylon sp. NC0597]|nr:hypothetical protein F4776DRAFT_436784 [Hypoxylon sp. NC0597]
MQAIVALLALLSFAEASLKTPRTAISPNPSSTTTTLEAALSSTTIPATSASSTQLTSDVDVTAKNRNTVFPLDEPTSSSTMAASNPKITPSPELNPPGANFHEMNAKYVQTTYWSCVTFPLETHCGWHQPILDAGAGRIGCEGRGQAALRAGVVAGVIAGGLVLGM